LCTCVYVYACLSIHVCMNLCRVYMYVMNMYINAHAYFGIDYS